MIRHFDAFTGFGGFTIAAKKVFGDELETIGFSEVDKYANQVLKFHFPNAKNYGDITKIIPSELPDFDLLTGGSPCQDLSIAGQHGGIDGERSSLFFNFRDLLNSKKPRYFIWENVRGALQSNGGFDFGRVLLGLADCGYSLWWQILNSKDFGVAQNRERVFVIGFRDITPPEIFFESENDRLLGAERLETPAIVSALTKSDHKGASKQRPNLVIPALSELTLGQPQSFRVYDADGLSVTLSSQGGGVGAKTGLYSFGGDNIAIRKLTPLECERLMGLADGWTENGIDEAGRPTKISDNQRYQLCGNGVVVNVVEFLLEKMIQSNQ